MNTRNLITLALFLYLLVAKLLYIIHFVCPSSRLSNYNGMGENEFIGWYLRLLIFINFQVTASILISQMMIHKIPSSVDYNYWLKRLNNHLNKSYNQISLKVPKVVKPTNKKTLLKYFGD